MRPPNFKINFADKVFLQPVVTNPLPIQIRDKVELHVQAGETIAVFTVRVQDIWSDGLVIDRPIIDQRLMPAPPGKTVDIYFQRQDATYRFASRIIRESQLDNLPILVIQQPREIERIQRREHFRLDIDLPIRFRKLHGHEADPIMPTLRGNIINLSAGGVKFGAELPEQFLITPNEILSLSFSLTNTFGVVGLEAVILKADPDPRLSFRHTLICRFLNIPSNIQEAIIVHNIRYQQRYRVESRGR